VSSLCVGNLGPVSEDAAPGILAQPRSARVILLDVGEALAEPLVR